MFLFDTFSQFHNAHRQVTNSFYLLLICIAEMINRKPKQQVVAKQNTLADIIDFNIEFINLIFCFLFLLSKTGSESTALTASAT
jgi:hypothetical protein